MTREIRIIPVENGFLVIAQDYEKDAQGRRYVALDATFLGALVADLATDFLEAPAPAEGPALARAEVM